MIVFEIIGMGAKKYGGFEKYIVEEAFQLQSKGHKLVVIFNQKPLVEKYVRDLDNLGVSIEILSQETKKQFIKGFIQLLKKYRPSIVHTNFSSNLFLAHPLAWMFGIKCRIATEHCQPEFKGIRNRVAAQLMTLITQKILPVSNASSKNLRKALWYGGKNIETLYLGVEDFCFEKKLIRSELGILENTIALINIAYHNPIKGVDILIDAMNIIVNEYGIRNLILYQIGGGQTGKDTEYLHSKAKECGLTDFIVWMGIRNDVPKLLSAGHIYIQPSRSEGVPLSIMEASIAKLPIVATEVGGIPEVAIDGENAILVPPNNPNAMADAILKLYNDTTLRRNYGNNSRNIALQKFSLKNNVTKLIENYYQL